MRKAKLKHSQVIQKDRERIDADRARRDIERAANAAHEKALHDSEVKRMQRILKGLEDEVRRVRDEKFAEEGAVKAIREEIRQAMEEKENIRRGIEDAETEHRQARDAVKEESALIRAKAQ